MTGLLHSEQVCCSSSTGKEEDGAEVVADSSLARIGGADVVGVALMINLNAVYTVILTVYATLPCHGIWELRT